MELITSHMNADFDAFSSMVAARKLYPEAALVFPGSQERKVREFVEKFFPLDTLRVKDVQPEKVTRLIIVDTKHSERIGPLASLLLQKDLTVHLYDHHEHLDGDIHGTLEFIEPVGATATIFTEILRERSLRPSAIEATALCLGIYEETGTMLFPSTTGRDLEAVAWLLKCGANLNIVANFMHEGMNLAEVRLLGELTESAVEHSFGGLRITIATGSSEEYIGDAAPLAHRVNDIYGTDAIFMLVRMGGKVLMVGRSRTPQLNVADVLEHFGGGGHPTAASATVTDRPLEILNERLLAHIEENIIPGKFAQDVMTAPVVSILETQSVKEARAMIARYDISVLPVVANADNGERRFRGIISRENIEKTIFHGFGQSPVADFMDSGVSTAERYTPVKVIEEDMISQNQRFMPVLEKGLVVGAITRTDLLRSMYDDYLRRARISEQDTVARGYSGRNISSLMNSRFPQTHRALLKLAGETAREMNCKAYLVGGTVRDLIMSNDNLDLDLVIEGDGIAFARALGTQLSGKVHAHERFKTAKLVLPDGLHVDIASARTEYYETPASLPVVEMSSIKKDLYRRDFTINALAVCLNPGEFGRLVDFFGGRRDIKDRSVRVLHNLSLVEDPTRAFRAVRFASRFGFRISRHTQNLIRSALRLDLFSKLSGTRIYDEMELIFREVEPTRALRRLSRHGLLKAIHPALVYSTELETLMSAVHETLTWYELLYAEEKPRQAPVYFAALLSSLTAEEKLQAADRLTMPADVRRAVLDATDEARLVLMKLPLQDALPIHDTLSKLRLESLLLAMSMSSREDVRRDLSRYIVQLRSLEPLLKGEDLKSLGLTPGPVFKRIFEALLHRRLTGELVTREDELEFVRSHWVEQPSHIIDLPPGDKF